MAASYTVTRSSTIDAPPDRIYAQIIDFHHWAAWSPWEDLDPDLRKTFSGPASEPGATYEWSGNRKAGQGKMKIVEANEHSRISIALDFLKPFKSSSTTTFDLEPNGAETTVTWTMIGPTTLMTRLMGLFTSMDKMIGPDFEKGLDRLKSASEAPTS